MRCDTMRCDAVRSVAGASPTARSAATDATVAAMRPLLLSLIPHVHALHSTRRSSHRFLHSPLLWRPPRLASVVDMDQWRLAFSPPAAQRSPTNSQSERDDQQQRHDPNARTAMTHHDDDEGYRQARRWRERIAMMSAAGRMRCPLPRLSRSGLRSLCIPHGCLNARMTDGYLAVCWMMQTSRRTPARTLTNSSAPLALPTQRSDPAQSRASSRLCRRERHGAGQLEEFFHAPLSGVRVGARGAVAGSTVDAAPRRVDAERGGDGAAAAAKPATRTHMGLEIHMPQPIASAASATRTATNTQ